MTFECHNGWTNNNSSSLIPQNVNNLSKKVFHFDLFFCSSNGIYIHIQQRHLSMIKKKKTIRQYYLSETKSCNLCNIPRASNDINDKLSFFISTCLDPFYQCKYRFICMIFFHMLKYGMIMQTRVYKKYTTKWMNEEEKICVWLIKHAYYPYSACITISLSFSCMTKISKKMTAKEKKTKKIKYCNSTKAIFRFSAH